jgi:hypothetical protein
VAKAIRVSDGNKWMYVPTGSEHQTRLEHFAASGLADIVNGTVMLKSDAGPIFWDLISKDFNGIQEITPLLKLAGEKSLCLLPDEELSFGKIDDAIAYNPFADVSLIKQKWAKGGLRLDLRQINNGGIVTTLWPNSGKIIPARIKESGKRLLLETIEPQDEGERCFVLDDQGKSLLTISFPVKNKSVFALNPQAMDSWLCSAGSKSILKLSGRFSINSENDGSFIISDKKHGKTYAGRFHYEPSDHENMELEKSHLERLLANKGLGAILPSYVLKRIQQNG